MRINKHDTQGTKPLLSKGELGYDDYTAGGDTGRVYVGTGTENIALAERLESNMMTKAQFNALAEERKANRAGSGFDNFGRYYSGGGAGVINDSMFAFPSYVNSFALFYKHINGGYEGGSSKTAYPIVNINGVKHNISSYPLTGISEVGSIFLPTAPNIYPHDTVLTTEQIASGVIKHADSSNSGLIVNGKFDTDTSGWVSSNGGVISHINGNLQITKTDTGWWQGAKQTIPTVIGKKYVVEAIISETISAAAVVYAIGTGYSVTSTSASRVTLEFIATAVTSEIFLSFNGSNGAVGSVLKFDNISVYPADAISRSDLVFLESWHEDISEKNFVYPLGNTQYLGGNVDSLTGIANGAFSGFETYSLFGNWQTSGALIGKGYVWSSLTEAQKRAFIANPENNCYLDGDKTIQIRYRVRVIQGVDDAINPFTKGANSSYLGLIENGSSSAFLINAKGKRVSSEETKTYANRSSTGTYGYAGGADTVLGTPTVAGDLVSNTTFGTPTNVAYEGKCFALPIALVHRRNQGMYHNVFNPNGTKLASDGLDCFRTNVSFTSISDCFDPAKLLTASGYIGTVRGRPDGLFYDQVHEGDITDLRNSSKKTEDYNRLISREFNKLVAGTTRGKEGEFELRPITVTSVINATLENRIRILTVNTSNVKLGNKVSFICKKNGIEYYVSGIITSINTNAEFSIFYGQNNQSSMVTSGVFPYNALVSIDAGSLLTTETTRVKSNTLTHCDIIGNPANYPASWKQNGVFGTPLIVAEDGTSLLPNGTLDSFKLSRKANTTPLLCLRSTDNGTTWTSFTPTFSTTTNAITLTDEPAANLVMVYYQTRTSMAVPVINSEVLEIGDVFASNSQYTYLGGFLGASLIGKVSIGTLHHSRIKVNMEKYYTSEVFSTETEYAPTHSQLILSASNGFKTFPYLTRLNGKAYLNLVFKEMKYGSYLAPTVVTNASATYTTNMLYKVNFAGSELDGMIVKRTGGNITTVVDWSDYASKQNGDIYLISTGAVITGFKIYDGDSWGDDGKFNIVNNVSTTLDDNGQTVLIGQKTVELPYFIGADE